MDETIHQAIRLKIMAALRALTAGESIEFVRLRAVVQATEGNFGAHLATLEKAGYIAIEKDFVGKKPRTRIALTPEGLVAFESYLAQLRQIIG